MVSILNKRDRKTVIITYTHFTFGKRFEKLIPIHLYN